MGIELDSSDYVRFGIGLAMLIIFGLVALYASRVEEKKPHESPWENGPDIQDGGEYHE